MIRTRMLRTMLLFTVAATSLTSRPTLAQTLREYTEAEASKGCDSIPYSTQRSNCKDMQDYVKKFCDLDRSCKIDQVGNIKKMNDKIGEMQTRIAELDRLRSDTGRDKDKDAKETKELQDKIAVTKQNVIEATLEVNVRIDNNEHCRDYRRKVQGIYSDAINNAEKVDDAEKKPIALRLAARWKETTKDHQNEIENVVDRIQECRNRREGRE
jgi:hypothetical protein